MEGKLHIPWKSMHVAQSDGCDLSPLISFVHRSTFLIKFTS
jgi:hypothetical protein